MATRTWKLKENIKADADGEIITDIGWCPMQTAYSA